MSTLGHIVEPKSPPQTVERNIYDNAKQPIVPHDFENPNYGVEVEFSIKPSYHDYGSSVYGNPPFMDKEGKIGSFRFKAPVLDEFYPRVEDEGLLGSDGPNLEIRYFPGPMSRVMNALTKLYNEPLNTIDTSVSNNSVGIHVHSDRRNYRPSDLYRNCQFFFSANADIKEMLTKIARRPINQSGSYGYVPPFDHIKASTLDLTRNGAGRMGICMFTPHQTHEFRIFKTTDKQAEAKSCVEFVDALLYFCRDEQLFEESATKFKEFISNKNYSNLKEVLCV